jgi:predicted type IV restriction endonuclease
VSEADTVTVVKDLLSDLFGYDKYAEVTSEHAIRGTYCDLAIKLDGKLRLLLEVKSIGLQLNEKHIKQAVDYAANQGLDWVVLTNGIRWMLFQISFKISGIRSENFLFFHRTFLVPFEILLYSRKKRVIKMA